MKKKNAFTLAEVLITLGIIGIVAALTLPAIIQKMEDKSLRTAFLKQYSVMNTVMKEIQTEKGVAYECGNVNGVYTENECTALWDDFFSKYKILKTCRYRTAGCGVVYKKKADVLAQGGKINNSNCTFLDSAAADAHMLADGSIIYTTSQHGGLYFATDINGLKGPNRWGYDMFYMTLDTSKGQIRLTDAVCAMWERGGRRVQNILLDNDDENTKW